MRGILLVRMLKLRACNLRGDRGWILLYVCAVLMLVYGDFEFVSWLTVFFFEAPQAREKLCSAVARCVPPHRVSTECDGGLHSVSRASVGASIYTNC
jgi:hypothetical protein